MATTGRIPRITNMLRGKLETLKILSTTASKACNVNY